MAFLNRCIWTATSSGTGSFVVSGAAQNGYTPANCLDPAVVDGTTYHYFAINGTDHEEGDGVWTTSTSTLTRATVRNSSNSGSAVSFAAAPIVFMGGPTAADMLAIGAAVASATAGSVLFVSSGPVLAQDNGGLFYDSINKALTLGGATVTANKPVITCTQTWNNAAVSFVGCKLAITNTAAAVGSRLVDLTVGNLEFLVTANLEDTVYGQGIGLSSDSTNSTNFTLSNTSTGGHAIQFFSTGSANGDGAAHFGIYDLTARSGNGRSLLDLDGNTGNVQWIQPAVVGWSNNANFTGTFDVGFARNAAGVVEVNNGTAGTLRDMKLRNLSLAAGTTSIAPLTFASGTNLTTATVGDCEFDGTAFYQTAVASSRQVVATEQVEVLSGSRTLTNNTSAQAIFNASANGAITLAGSTTFEFEMMVAASGFSSSSHTIQLGFAGTATFTSIGYFYDENAGSTLAGPTTSLSGFVATASATTVTASVTTTGLVLRVRGTMRVNAGGTVIPQLTQVTASGAAVVQANSFFRCWPIGSNTVTNVGNWS